MNRKIEGSKLGAGVPRHASTAPEGGGRAMLTLAREALRPPVASLPSRGFRAPCTDDEGRSGPSTQTNRAPVGYAAPALSRCIDNQGALPPDTPAPGFRARHHEQGSSGPMHPGKALFALDPNPPVRRLDTRHRLAVASPVRGISRPGHPRAAARPLHCAP